MCGRYTNETEFSQIRLLFQAVDSTFRPWTPKFNISPSSGPGYEQLLVTADRPGSRQIRLGRFWFIPAFWSKPLSELPTTFNARSEDLTARKIWREPFAHARCLIPATGWREFLGTTKPKQPYHFRPALAPEASASTFAFAGLHSTWTSKEGEVVDSFAILTTAPSEAASRIHDRMPLFLPTELHDAWLSDDSRRAEVLAEARAFTARTPLEIFPSDPVANNVHYEGPAAVRRIDLSRPDAPARGSRPRPARGGDERQLSLLDPAPRRRRGS